MRKIRGLLGLLLCLALLVSLVIPSTAFAARTKITAAYTEDDAEEVKVGQKYTIKNPNWWKVKEDPAGYGKVKFTAGDDGRYIFKFSNCRRPGHTTKDYGCNEIVGFSKWNASAEEYQTFKVKCKDMVDYYIGFCSQDSYDRMHDEENWSVHYTKGNIPINLEKGDTIYIRFGNSFDGLIDMNIIKAK